MDDEFIELYNSGNESVDVSGYLLKIRFPVDAHKALDPNGTVIGPGEFLVIFVSESVYQGNEGDAIMLYDHGDLVDEKEYDAATEDVSLPRSRMENGATAPLPRLASQTKRQLLESKMWCFKWKISCCHSLAGMDLKEEYARFLKRKFLVLVAALLGIVALAGVAVTLGSAHINRFRFTPAYWPVLS